MHAWKCSEIGVKNSGFSLIFQVEGHLVQSRQELQFSILISAHVCLSKIVTFHAKTCIDGFPFSNGILFRSCLKAVWKKFAFVWTTWVIRSKKICIRSSGLITGSVEMSSRSNDLLTRLLKTSNRSNDFLTRLLEHPSVQTTWVNRWMALIIHSGKKISRHTCCCLYLFAYSRVHVSYTEKNPFDHLNSLLADYVTITKYLQIMKLIKKQST